MKKIVYSSLLFSLLASCSHQNAEPVVETMGTGLISLDIATESPIHRAILEESQGIFQEMGYGLHIEEGIDEGELGEVLLYYNPMGLYSVHFDENIADGAMVALPFQEQSEALLLLEEKGLISLAGMSPFDLADVEANYFDLVLMEVENPVDLVEQVDYVVETGEKAWSAGLPPAFAQGRYGAVYGEDGVVATVLTGEEMQDFIATEYRGYLSPLS